MDVRNFRAGNAAADELMKLSVADWPTTYTDRDAMLYALSIGLGRDGLEDSERDFVVEHNGLLTVPTLATVVSHPALARSSGLDFTRVVHAEQSVVLQSPLPASGSLLTNSNIVSVLDKGVEKGVYVTTRSRTRDAVTGQLYFESTSTLFARGDGGIGSAGSAPLPAPAVPRRDPDAVVLFQTRPDQALWYRLNGDRNPLHTNGAAAAKLGLPAPILHGLCTYGIACRAVLRAACNYVPTRMRAFSARFTQPVFVGESIRTELWLDGAAVSFRCLAQDRDVVVLDRGMAVISA
jgi:acyl dehydratase